MTVRNITKFDVTPNLAAVGVTEFYFNNDSLTFEFTIVDDKGITSTVKTPEVTTEKKRIKKTDSIMRGIKKDLFPSIQQYEDSFLAIEEDIESQIEDSSEEIQDRVTASKKNTNGDVEKSAATLLVELAMENIKQLFKDQYGYAFAVIHNDDHDEILKISDKNEKCKLYLGRLFYLTQNKTVNAESISNAIHTLQAEAIFNGEEITLDVRVAWSSPKREEIHYDMTDSQWRRIIITNQGWRISNDINPILFTRFNQKSQIEPDRTYPLDIFDQFLDLMHIEGYNNRLLAKTWIITLLVPDIPHTIDLVFGTQGGAKSTFYKFVKRLVDPDKIELLSVPRQNRAAVSSHTNDAVCTTNVSQLFGCI
jgi:hypothetical protein